MTINTIIKKALERLKQEGKLLTPDFYAEAFCKEAKRAGMIVDDCNQVDKYAKTLNDNYQKELARYHLTTTQELIRYLISTLNRINPSNCISMLNGTNLLFSRVLETIDVLHNQEAAKLAKQTRELLDRPNLSPQQLDNFRQLWVNFLTTYDDAFLNKLKPLGDVKRSDLRGTIQNLKIVKEAQKKYDLEGIVSLLSASMVPSIASSVNDTIASLMQTLHDNPEMITSKGMEQDILSAIKLRISLDKESLKQMILSLDDILNKLSSQLIDIIDKSDQSNLDIKAAKKELDAYNNHHDIDFKAAHHKLYTIALALEESAIALNDNAKAQNAQTQTLGTKIEKLEQELKAAKEASREDFLTKLYNKRAIDEFLKMKENEYDRYDRDYSIVMFDIDHFKKVNDTYGHEAGDIILAAFAKILKETARKVDVVGRVGGEEFIALLSQTDAAGAIKFAKKVLQRTQEAKFIYKKQTIAITVSAGASQRARLTSLQGTLNSADEYLYAAKKNGRNRVEPSK